MIKSIMILESGIIPLNTNFERAHPTILVDEWKLHFPTQPIPWPAAGLRRISLNGMGFGGTNGHVILDDAYSYLAAKSLEGIHDTVDTVPSHYDVQHMCNSLVWADNDNEESHANSNGAFDSGTRQNELENGYKTMQTNGNHANGHSQRPLDEVRNGNGGVKADGDQANGVSKPRPHLFLLPAFDENGVQRNAQSYAAYLKQLSPMSVLDGTKYLADLAHTLTNSRSQFPWRSFCVAATIDELADSLKSSLSKPVGTSKSLSVGFVFTGQGA
jgi:acyl transferase domain-containing protein